MCDKIPNVAFLHIPKTAGTSLQTILEKSYPEENIFRWRDRKIIPDERCRQQRGNIFMGHFHFGVQNQVFDQYDLVTFLRNPIERTISHLYFYRRSIINRDDLVADQRRALLEKSVADLSDLSRNWLVDNVMVRMLSGVRDSEPFGALTDDHLDAAMTNLSKFSYVGFQGNFGNDLRILSNLYGWKRRVLPRNVRRETYYLDGRQRRRLIQYNRLDLALYQHGLGVRADRLREFGLCDRWQNEERSWLWRLAAFAARVKDIGRYKTSSSTD